MADSAFIGLIYLFIFLGGFIGIIVAVSNNKKKIKERMEAAKRKEQEKAAKAANAKSEAQREYERIISEREKPQTSPYFQSAYSSQNSYSKSSNSSYNAPVKKVYEKKFAKYYGGKMAERSFTVVKSKSYLSLLKNEKLSSFTLSPREANSLILLHSNSGRINRRGALKNKNIYLNKTDYFKINDIGDNTGNRAHF